MKKPFYIYNILFLLPFFNSIFALTVGSDTEVSVESFITFPAEDLVTQNKIKAFAWMKNGFQLEDSTTSCTFASVYPVSGTIDLNGGILELEQDLRLKSNMSINSWGSIIGNDHRVDLCSSVTSLPEANFFQDTTLIIDTDLILTQSIIFKGDCVITGNENALILDTNAALIVESNSSLELRNLQVNGIKDTNIRCVDDTASIILDTIDWVQVDDYTFANGSFLFKDNVNMMGAALFNYESVHTSTIQSYAELSITQGMHFCIGRFAIDAPDPLYFEDVFSSLIFNNSSWIINSNGMQLTRGTLVFENNVDVDIQSTSSQNGLLFGNGILADDLTIDCRAGTVVNQLGGHLAYGNNLPNKLLSVSKTAKLIRQENSYIIANTGVIIPEITVELVSDLVPAVAIASGASFQYDRSQVILPGVEYDFTGDQLNAYTYVMTGTNSLFLTKGLFPLFLNVSGVNNKIQGNGSLSGYITFTDSDSRLVSSVTGAISSPIILNEGTLQLDDDLNFNSGGILYGPGIIDINSYWFDLGPQPVIYNTPLYWLSSSGKIDIHEMVSLASTWTFDGDCIINGNGNILNLLDGAEILITDGSKLTFKNIKVRGVSGENIKCLGDLSCIHFLDTDWVLDDNFTFSYGCFEIIKDTTFKGKGYTFVYDSSFTSTIDSSCTLKIADIEFMIGKKDSTSVQPLYFQDITAVLHLDNAQLTVPPTGLQLSRGTIVATRDIITEVQSTSTNACLEFGDGTSEGDIVILFYPGSTNRFTQGHSIYNVTDIDKGIISRSSTAQFTRDAGTVLYVKQDVAFKTVTVALSPLSQIIVETGKAITFEDVTLQLPTSQSIITATRHATGALSLMGDQIVNLVNGALLLPIIVSGTDNTLQGTGDLMGSIILANSAAELVCDFSGFVLTDIVMNSGSIVLENNLILGNGNMLSGVGTVTLNSNSFHFGNADLMVTSTITWHGDNATLNFHAPVRLTGEWIFDGTCEINGNGYVLDMSDSGHIQVANGAQLRMRDVQLQRIHDQNINCADGNSSLIFDGVEWIQSADYVFNTGSFLIDNYNVFSGPYTFHYDTIQSSTINILSELHILDHLQLLIHTQGQLRNIINMQDSTSVFHFEDAILTITGVGAQFTQGRIVCENDVTIETISTSTTNGLVLGDGTLEGDLVFQFIPGTTVNYPRGHVLINLVNPASITSKSNTAKLIRGSESFYHLTNDVSLQDLTLKIDFNAILTQEAGKVLSFTDVTNETPVGNFDITGIRYSAYGNMLTGSDNFIFLSRGVYPLLTVVNGSANSILGNGTISGPIAFAGPTADLAWALNGSLLANVTLNGGRFRLDRDLFLGPDVLIEGPGEVNLQGNRCFFGPKNITSETPLYFNSNGGDVQLRADLILDTTWTFSGMCTLRGNGNILTISDNGEIFIEDGSELTMRDITVQNITGTKVHCADDAGVLTLDNVIWRQSDDYIFDTGALSFKNNVKMQGSGYVFAYQSIQTSTIVENSQLYLDAGYTFSYDNLMYKDRIEFIDYSSELYLNGATFHTTSTGINFINGTIHCGNQSVLYVETDANGLSGGITLGDSLGNDAIVIISAGSTVYLVGGQLNYRNTNLNSLIMSNLISNIRFNAGTQFNLYEDISLSPGSLTFDAGAILARLANKTITGSIVPFGSIQFITLTE